MLSAAILPSALLTCSVYAEEERAVKNILTVSELGDDYIVAVNDNESVRLNITDDTIMISSETQLPILPSDLEIGETISCEYSPMMTRSIPPQSKAFFIASDTEKDGGVTMVYADDVKKDKDGNLVVSDEMNNLELTISKDASIAPYKTKNIVTLQDIEEDSMLLAWYDIQTLSLPARAYTEKVVLLPYKYDDAEDKEDKKEQKQEKSGERAIKNLLTVSELGENFIVAGDDSEAIRLNINDSTVLIDSETQLPILPSDLKIGEKILCEYSQMMTRSIPPQSNAILIASNTDKGGSVSTVYADDVKQDKDGNLVVSDEINALELTISKNASIAPYKTRNIVTLQDICEDSVILAWFDAQTFSIPAKSYTEKVVVLPYKFDDDAYDDNDDSEEKLEDELEKISDWAKSDIKAAKKIGMFADKIMQYQKDIDREQFCELTYNMLNGCGRFKAKSAGKSQFKDTDNEKIQSLADAGIISGKDAETFAPKDLITREEAAAIICRAASLIGIYDDDDFEIEYDDDDDISDWAKSAVYELNRLKVMSGTDKGFAPKSNITVEQSAAALMRLYRIIDKNDSFADRMNSQMTKEKNYVFSPFSVKMAFAMAAIGAEGETKDEILKALDIDDPDKYNAEAKKIIEKYSQSDLLMLNISNSLWMNTDRTPQSFSKEYTDTVSDIFNAETGTVTDEDAAKKINAWVNEKTKGKITSIIGEKNTDFDAMLLNAVYFKGNWVNEFNKNATKPDTFTDRNGKESSIDFMNRTAWMSCGAKDGVQIVSLPYLTREDIIDESGNYTGSVNLEDMDLSMYLMMSDSAFNPEAVLKSTELSNEYIALSVPKFNIEYSADISEQLKNMGINSAFDKYNAQFEGMVDNGNMFITDAIHKTYITVDEKGTEAAAVTGIGMGTTSLPPEPVEIKFDKPFTFVIRDNESVKVFL